MEARVALTLRRVAGLTVPEIARLDPATSWVESRAVDGRWRRHHDYGDRH
jgi:predicted RNA polymerase sigma factor